ncbi:hypothetical protein KOW79_022203 [Hemibagrus wyckioides]|uniref:Uncharacterized protein n=1 Tax=Hemibagrus wyckioides TaxID=337641 RepID=A0A9D3S930_9TELE|nr:hypothetical protein KOW79_022203 [Hemibagrus wyckioides]
MQNQTSSADAGSLEKGRPRVHELALSFQHQEMAKYLQRNLQLRTPEENWRNVPSPPLVFINEPFAFAGPSLSQLLFPLAVYSRIGAPRSPLESN